MTKVAIVGSGALGGFYGGLLARSGVDVHFLMRSDASFVQKNGLRIDSKLGDFHLPHVNAYESVQEMPKCDFVILALKSTQNHLLTDLLPPLMHEGSMVLVLQNGLHVEHTARLAVGPARVAGGCCFLCSNKVGPGHIRHLDYGKILMGAFKGLDDSEVGPSEESMGRIQHLLSATGIDCNVTPSLTLARWRKLMWNIPFNGLSVILNSSTDAIMMHRDSRALAKTIIQEVRQTACDCGHDIEPGFVDDMMEHTDEMVPYDSSMRLDFLAGREMEIEAIYGNALRAAERCNIHPPLIRTMYQQLKFLGNRASLLNYTVSETNTR
jgi:2-dehydropantoate 2-reductase